MFQQIKNAIIFGQLSDIVLKILREYFFLIIIVLFIVWRLSVQASKRRKYFFSLVMTCVHILAYSEWYLWAYDLVKVLSIENV